jgi:multiple sugar transport system ATP-binding protein
VYVTHDQVEAMSLADRIAVMNFAVLQQFDTPHNIYNRPKNLFVANFIGSPTINFFQGEYRGGEVLLGDFRMGKIPLSPSGRARIKEALRGEKLVIGIRPEHFKLESGNGDGMKARVVSFEPLGSKTIVYLHPDGNPGLIIKSSMESDYMPRIGETKNVAFKEKDLYVFDGESTDLIARLQ